tara:strand:- start:8813 stop:10753 length:1941 start_codon:yes stop_codon:yes gene_type:complete
MAFQRDSFHSIQERPPAQVPVTPKNREPALSLKRIRPANLLASVLILIAAFWSPSAPAESYPLPVAVTPLQLSGSHLNGQERSSIYTYAMSDAGPAPELIFINNRAYLIWNDSGSNGRISLLKPDLSGVEKDLVTIKGRQIADATSDGSSITVITLEWQIKKNSPEVHTAHIESYGTSGQARFRTRIVGTLSYDKEGDQGIDSAFSTFSVEWSGKEYATYFNTYRKWDDGVVHQSEYLALFDNSGKKLMKQNSPEGWTWNVSHSFRPKMAWDGMRFLMATVGDAYPRGLVVQSYVRNDSLDREVVIEVPKAAAGETYQYVVISTGDVYGKDGKGWIVFDSRLNRSDYDIGLIRTDSNGKASSPVWITRTSSARERIPRIHPLGDKFLLVWAVDTSGKTPDKAWFPTTAEMKTQIALVNEDGSISVNPFDVPATIRGANRLFRFPNGDAGWINDVTGDAKKMEIVRVSAPGSVVTDNTDTDSEDLNVDPDDSNTTDVVDPESIEYDPSLDLPILQSAMRGDSGAVQGFLSRGGNPNASYQGWHAIHYAAYYGHAEVCRLLLKAGAKPDVLIEGWSAMQLAESKGHPEVVEILKPVSRSRNRSLKPAPSPNSHLKLSKPLRDSREPAIRRRDLNGVDQAREISPPREH